MNEEDLIMHLTQRLKDAGVEADDDIKWHCDQLLSFKGGEKEQKAMVLVLENGHVKA